MADQSEVVYVYRTAPNSMALNDPKHVFQGQGIL